MNQVETKIAVIQTDVTYIKGDLNEIKSDMKKVIGMKSQIDKNQQCISDMKENGKSRMTMWGVGVAGVSLLISIIFKVTGG